MDLHNCKNMLEQLASIFLPSCLMAETRALEIWRLKCVAETDNPIYKYRSNCNEFPVQSSEKSSRCRAINRFHVLSVFVIYYDLL